MVTDEPITIPSLAPVRPGLPPRPVPAYAELDAYVGREMRRLHLPGIALAVVEGDRITHTRGFGRAWPKGGPPTGQTPFFIGSITKSITALAAMQLVEAGKIDLDTPVQRYLPWFRVADPAASARMTVRHLLNQTSGLPTSEGEVILADFDDSPGAAERQAQALSSLVLARSPGAAFEYSNSNYQLLGLIIEAASCESYPDYLWRHILTPLGMHHTTTSPATAFQNGLAIGQRFWFGRPVATPGLPVPYGAVAVGTLISTAEDLARYLIACLNGGRSGDARVLSAEGIAELLRGATSVKPIGLGPLERIVARGVEFGQYAMGWNIDKAGQTQVIWHGGTMPDYGGCVALIPEQKKGLVLLYNANHHWYMPLLSEFGPGAAAILAGEQPNKFPASAAIPWMLRGLLAIPVLQAAGVAVTLGRARRGAGVQSAPETGKKWQWRFAIPTLLHATLATLLLRPLWGRRRGYLRLYMPDFALVATVCGLFSAVWVLLRAALVIKASRQRN